MRLVLLILLLLPLRCPAPGLGNPGTTAALKGASASLFSGLTHAWKFEEATGATREDSVGSLDFTDGAMVWVQQAGKSGNCATNTSAGASLSSSGTAQLGTTWSIAFWVAHTFIVDSPMIISKGDGDFDFVYNATQINATIGDATLTGGALTSGAWNHVAVTFNGTTAILYVNGSQVDSDTSTFPNSDSLLIIEDFNNTLMLAIDELYIWNRAISAGEVTSLQTTFYTP